MNITLTEDKNEILIEGLHIVKINGRQLYRPPMTIGGFKWYDELSDPDPFFPSCPHLHCKGKPYKLNVYTGELYNTRTKQIIRNEKIRKKDLKELWENTLFLEFVKYKRMEYLQNYPNGILPEIPTFHKLNKMFGHHRRVYYKILKRRKWFL